MDQLPSNPILKFNSNQLYEVRKLFGQEDKEKLNQAIDQFEDWIKKQNHFDVTDFDRGFLERLIICSKGSLERAKQRLDKMCTYRKLLPEYMGNIDVKNEFNNFLDMSHACIFPTPTNENYRIFYCSINVKDHVGFDMLSFIRYFITILQYALHHEYAASTIVISDIKEFSFQMASKLNPIVVHKGLTVITDAFAYRLKALHIIIPKTSKFLDTLILFYKQILSAKLAQRIHVHTSYESLHQHIDKSILPVDIGGEYNKSCKEITDDLFKELCSDSHVACMRNMEKATTDESRRLSSTFNKQYSGMPGSFRTLCVD